MLCAHDEFMTYGWTEKTEREKKRSARHTKQRQKKRKKIRNKFAGCLQYFLSFLLFKCVLLLLMFGSHFWPIVHSFDGYAESGRDREGICLFHLSHWNSVAAIKVNESLINQTAKQFQACASFQLIISAKDAHFVVMQDNAARWIYWL